MKPVRSVFLWLAAFVALCFHAGCGGGSNTITADETSDPTYQQAQEFKKQERNSEALAAFLKVIDRRGESGAPESHLEAGILYRTWARDPVEAYHHFKKYLELLPTSPKADMVRSQRDAAYRDIAKFLLAPQGEQAFKLQANEELEQLRRRVQELEAENQTLRGAGVARGANRPPPMISLGEDRPSPPPSQVVAESPLTPAPQSQSGAALAQNFNPAQSTTRPSTVRPAAVPSPQRAVPPPQRPAAGGRTHTVAPKDSVWGIARRYYGQNATGAQVRAIEAANNLPPGGGLRPGMVLRIP